MVKEPNLHKSLSAYLKELRMPTVRDCYHDEAESARRESLSYERYLLELVRREAETRRHNRIERLLRQSKLPLEKNLDSFDLGRLPLRQRQQVRSLIEGSFLERRENVLAFGNPGSGKTHILCAIGQELIRQDRRVLFTTCSLLVQDLLIAKSELKLSKMLKRLSRFEALIIDDIAYVQQNREEMEVLFTLLAERYERGSVMLTSNLPFSKWEEIFKDPMTTAAAIDRLVHHCVILELNVKSYRMEQAKKRTPRKAEKEIVSRQETD
jgi:DNA replication protein DnaC